MTPRQRGAAYLLALLVLGRLLDTLDLPFERTAPVRPATETAGAPAAPPIRSDEAAERARAVSPDAAPSAAQRPRSTSTPTPTAVHVNTANAEELRALPGVGPVLAERIVRYRQTHGPLRSMEDLRKVKGIGARTAANLAPLVRFD